MDKKDLLAITGVIGLVLFIIVSGISMAFVMDYIFEDAPRIEKPDSEVSAEDIVKLEREQFGFSAEDIVRLKKLEKEISEISADLNNLEKMLIDLEKLEKEQPEKLEEEKETSPK